MIFQVTIGTTSFIKYEQRLTILSSKAKSLNGYGQQPAEPQTTDTYSKTDSSDASLQLNQISSNLSS